MSNTTITRPFAWEALDSRGKPTVGCEVSLSGGGRSTATVPSGASTGRQETHELRDGDARYGGNGVSRAVAHVTGEIADAVPGLDAPDQQGLDSTLRTLDGTPGLGRLGANAVPAVSVATARAAADAHAGRSLGVQDFLAVPLGAAIPAEAIAWASRIRAGTADVPADRGLPIALVADEGGLDRPGRGIAQGVANAVLVKPNQTGTLDTARTVVRHARAAGYGPVLSTRSGETEDHWRADLAVRRRTGRMKVGSATPSERTAKGNRLPRIEAELGSQVQYAGSEALTFAGRRSP
ncbi:hypothetical protein ACFWAZ_10240 [Streptomyces collinus]|uniref:hypothetical protein n=1 Tax=Streptomyces collinus TaxID=42684 RepID=UPI00364960A1